MHDRIIGALETCCRQGEMLRIHARCEQSQLQKFRPFIGRLRASPSETVAAIWLRAASRTVASAITVTLVSIPLTLRVTGSSNAAPTTTAR
jgi:hypothetical protein